MEYSPEDVEYLGIFLTPQSKEKLKRTIPPTFNQKSGDHITVVHSPDEEQLQKFSKYIGKKVVLTATHVVENNRIQAIRIKDIWTSRGAPHITISWANNASPVEANELVSTEPGAPIQPWLKLEGIFDVFPRSIESNPSIGLTCFRCGKRHRRNPIYPRCSQCEILVVNNIPTHELGCPRDWINPITDEPYPVECSFCGSEFIPNNRYQIYCSSECDNY